MNQQRSRINRNPSKDKVCIIIYSKTNRSETVLGRSLAQNKQYCGTGKEGLRLHWILNGFQKPMKFTRSLLLGFHRYVLTTYLTTDPSVC